MWHYGIWIHSPLTSVGVIHSTWLSRAMWHMLAPTFNKWHKKKRGIKIRRWHSPYRHMVQCKVVGWLLWWFALVTKNCGIRERNMTIRSEIWTTNILSLGFRVIREWVLIWMLIFTEFMVYFLIPTLSSVAIISKLNRNMQLNYV